MPHSLQQRTEKESLVGPRSCNGQAGNTQENRRRQGTQGKASWGCSHRRRHGRGPQGFGNYNISFGNWYKEGLEKQFTKSPYLAFLPRFLWRSDKTRTMNVDPAAISSSALVDAGCRQCWQAEASTVLTGSDALSSRTASRKGSFRWLTRWAGREEYRAVYKRFQAVIP